MRSHSFRADERLQEVLATGDLKNRLRPPDFERENQALLHIADALVAEPEAIFQRVSEIVMEACGAQSAGISIIESREGKEYFRWKAVAGAFSGNAGGTMHRADSPCGFVIDAEDVLLFQRPALRFPALCAIKPHVCEGLLAPFYLGDKPVGTVWALIHRKEQHFDAEDARVLKSLARFASGAYRLVSARERHKVARFEAEERLSEVEELRNRQNVLLKELNHRVGNLLTVVSAIAKQTVGRGGSIDDFQQRLAALSRAQGLLTRPQAGVKLEELVRAELAPYLGARFARVSIEGPPLAVPEAHVQSLALAVHELATNAMKYGALKAPAGQLDVRWCIEEGDATARVVLTWRETGVLVPQEALARRGFGRELIEEILSRTLNAEVNYLLGLEGVLCTISVPTDDDGAKRHRS